MSGINETLALPYPEHVERCAGPHEDAVLTQKMVRLPAHRENHGRKEAPSRFALDVMSNAE